MPKDCPRTLRAHNGGDSRLSPPLRRPGRPVCRGDAVWTHDKGALVDAKREDQFLAGSVMLRQRKFRALVLTPALHGTSPGQRFRVEQWAKYLEPEGFEFTFVPFEDALLHEIIYRRRHYARKASLLLLALARRLAVLRMAKTFDAIFLHREAALVGPAVIEPLLARQRVSIVFDFDDAIWVPYVSPANRFLSYFKCFGKAAAICRLSTHIIAGNRYLAEYAQRYNKRVTVVPTTIDTQAYTMRVPDGRDLRNPVTIGWTGSYSTVRIWTYCVLVWRCSLSDVGSGST